jgi:hypothetical protein
MNDYDRMHQQQRQLIGDINREYVMPIIRSGFRTVQGNELYKRNLKPTIQWTWGEEKEISRSESESDDFVLKGAL